jgi:predicted ferric reductase
VWSALLVVVGAPLIMAGMSPQLQWRDPVYIVAGFAGIIGMALLAVQPLLAARRLPDVSPARARRVHRWIGVTLIVCVVVHVGALWLTSPPDVIDALLFASPKAFSVWGVIAMWAIFASGLIALLRPRFSLRIWRLLHTFLFVTIVIGTVVHAALIDGTMEPVTKYLLGVAVIAATASAIFQLKIWARFTP